MVSASSQLAHIMDELSKQGVDYRVNSHGGYTVKFPDGAIDTFSASTDPKARRSQRAVVRRHGLHWPLDPLPRKPRRHRSTLEPSPARTPDPSTETENPMVVRNATPAAAKVVKVDPDLAAQWLERNTLNRKLMDGVVAKYKVAMESGRWHFDGAPIRFDKHGNLLDGQHRLWAIIESGTTQEFLVVEGLSAESFVVMDTGKSRNLADLISIEFPDYKSVTHLSAVTGIIYRWEQGGRGRQLHTRNIATNFRNTTNEELIEFFRVHHEEINDITIKSHGMANGATRGIAGSVYALGMWVFSRIDEADNEDFFDRLKNGSGLEVGDPILTLRNALMKFVASSGGLRATLATDVAAAFLFKTWNAYRRGDQMRQMSYRPGGHAPEKFPIPE